MAKAPRRLLSVTMNPLLKKTLIIELRQQITALKSRYSKLESELRFELDKFKSSNDDMQYYTGMENHAQFKALYDFLDGNVNACSRLNYWGSNNSNLQLDGLEKRGKKCTLLPVTMHVACSGPLTSRRALVCISYVL